MSEDLQYDWMKFKRFLACAGAGGIVLVAISILYKALFMAFAVGLILSYILTPAVNKLVQKFPNSRNAIIFFVTITFFGFLLVLAASIMPTIYKEVVEIVKQVPKSVVYLNQKIVPVRDWMVGMGFVSYESFDRMILDLDLMQKLTSTTTNALERLWASTPQFLGGALNAFLIPLFTWFFLRHIGSIKSFVKGSMPSDVLSLAQFNVRKMDVILWGVVKGQLLVAMILSILYMIGFSVISLQSGLAIGALAGMCRVVPYLDVLVGGTLSIIVILGKGGSMGMILAVFIVIAIVQSLDGALITPRIIGERAGIHPVVVIASVFAFGDWFGLLGIVLAVPVVAIVASAVQMSLPYYRSSPFFRRGR